MKWLSDFGSWLPWLGLGTAAGATGLVLLFGGAAVLSVVASVVEVLAPLVRAFVEAMIEWVKIMWNGFVDVIDNWKTIAFVLSLCAAVWAYTKVDTKMDMGDRIEQCQAQVTKLNTKLKQCKRW